MAWLSFPLALWAYKVDKNRRRANRMGKIPGSIIRRTMTSMGIAPDQIPQLTEKIFDDQAKSMAGLITRHQKPLIGYTFQSHEELYIQKLLHHGVPVFPSPERAARAMAPLFYYSQLVDRIKPNT